MQESDESSPGAPRAAPAAQSTRTALISGPSRACRDFLRSSVAAGTTLLAIATAAAGLVLLLVTLLIGADKERTMELRATQFGDWSKELGPEAGNRVASRANLIMSDKGPATTPFDALRWIRTAAFALTSIGLVAIATCAIHQKWSTRRQRSQNWTRPNCTLSHRYGANAWQAIRATLGANATELLGNRLTVRQVMCATTPLASPNTSIRALKSMLAARPSSLVAICDPKGHLLGVVGDVDLRRRRGTCAADVMTRDPYTAPPGARLDAAVTLMLDNQIHSLPVVENGLLRGMLTTADLITALDCVLQAIREVSTASVSRSTDTQTIRNQETKRFPPAPVRQDEPPDTMTAPLIG